MDWGDMWKLGVVIVASSVVSAVITNLILNQAKEQATLAARAEMQKLMVAAAANRELETPPITAEVSQQPIML